MAERPDMKFDIDALFRHMTRNLGYRVGTPREWHFLFESRQLAKLRALRKTIGAEFDCGIEKSVPAIHNGRECPGPPMLSAVRVAALRPEQIKTLAARLQRLATRRGVEYRGVSCYEPIDEQELFGWLDLEAAGWRLRHFSDCGLKAGENLLFIFALGASTPGPVKVAAKALRRTRKFRPGRVRADESRGGKPLLLVRSDGKNDERLLVSLYGSVERAAQAAGATVLGVQFLGD